ncbi:very long chain fatty acid elongase AAEL008004-like [Lycorma delicatula]|uniref:very long chain fatty acid elongase AAEL008004-like n=1 Tax=Lycorma delicatula TaxID=130591 RepID=UPI003F50E04F
MGFIENVAQSYHYFFDELGDHRTSNFSFTDPKWPSIIVSFYLLFVIYLGPKLMRNRPPFDIQYLVIIYNISQIIFCSLLFTSAVRSCYLPLKYSLICQPVETGTSPEEMHIAGLVWYYYMIKIYDLFDTIFIVLRKKSSQLSVLHIYHHSGMVIASWVAIKYVPGGQSILTGTINCFVHAVMYLYYLLTIVDSKYRTTWWKKHITQLQLVQFAAIGIHFLFSIIMECGYPTRVAQFYLPVLFAIVLLFINFYWRAYIRNQEHDNKKM